MKVLIKETLSKHKFKDLNGYLICTDCILARTGKQSYRKNEVFATDDISEIEIDRPYEEVFDAKTLASFENVPLCKDHPDEDVTPENHNSYSVGFVRNIRQGKDNNTDVIIGDLVITDSDVIELVENGEYCELSCGYNTDIIGDDREGYKQTNIRGNHVALCQQGRAGNARIVDSVKDSLTNEEKQLVDYVIENLDHNNNSEEAIRIMKNYSSEYQKLAYNKPEEVKEYFERHLHDSVKDSCVVSSDSFGVATMYGPSSKEDLEKLANAGEKVYLEYEVNGRNRGFWKAASSLLRELNLGKMRITTVYDSRKIKDIDVNRVNEILNNYDSYVSKLKTLEHALQSNKNKLSNLEYELNSYYKYDARHGSAKSSNITIDKLKKQIENLKFEIEENEDEIASLESMLKEAKEAEKSIKDNDNGQVIAKYYDNSSGKRIYIVKYPNGKYYNEYGPYMIAGAYSSLEEAEKYLLKHRPSAIEIKDSDNSKPTIPAKGEWIFDEVKQDWYDTGRHMFYSEVKDLHHISDAKMTPDRMIQIIEPIVRDFAKRKGVEDYWKIHKNGNNVSVGIELGYRGLDELCDILNKKLEPLTESYFEPADGGLIETTIFDSKVKDEMFLRAKDIKVGMVIKENTNFKPAKGVVTRIIPSRDGEGEYLTFIVKEGFDTSYRPEDIVTVFENESTLKDDSLESTNEEVTKSLEKNLENFKENRMNDRVSDEIVKLYQDKVDYQLEHFGRIGGGLYDELDDNGLYVDNNNIVKRKVNDSIKDSKPDLIKLFNISKNFIKQKRR